MFVKQFHVGGDRNFGYLAADEDTKLAVVIDPSYSPESIVQFAKDNHYIIEYVINTHKHFDHTNGNQMIEKLTGIKPVGFGDVEKKTGQTIRDNTELPLGELVINIRHTPGHTQDSICIHVGNAVFTGDTLFVGKVGGTDFGEQAREEYNSLHRKLLTLPNETQVYPGHHYGVAPTSTIGHERNSNPFLLQPNLDSFIDLKKNWTQYKKEHGIA